MASQSLLSRHDTDTRDTDRGQTSIDLLLAVGLFFTAIAIVTIQSPTLFGIHGIGASDNRVPADAAANTLEQDILATTTSTGLHEAKVRDFFSGDDSDVTDRLSLPSTLGAHVQLTHIDSGDPPTPLHDNSSLTTYNTTDGNVYVERGPEPDGIPTTVDKYTTLNNKRVRLTVTVWLQ